MAFGNLFELGLHIKADGLEDAKKAFAVVGKGGEEVVRASKAQQREINKGINLLRQMAAAVDKNDKAAVAGLQKLAAEQKQWTVAVGGTTSQLLRLSAVERNIADMADHANKSSLAFGKLKGVLATLGIGISVGAVVGLFKSAIEEANDAESAMAELQQAVDNVGGSFDLLKPSLDAAATGMQRTTRFSDDLTRRALATMIRVSGDTAGSLKNIGLAADVAAAKHIDLNEAAELIARTMTGNTRALRQFGIQTNDAAKGIELLRERVRGFAEKDATTFQGKLQQVKNAWLDVLESFGKAVTGADSVPGVLETIRVKLGDLANWIDKNAEKWRGWAKAVTDAASPLVSWLNKLVEKIQQVGLAMHGIATGNFGALRAFNAGGFGDVKGGASTGANPGDTLNPMVISGTAGNNTPPPNTGTGSRSGVAIPRINIDFGTEDTINIGRIGQPNDDTVVPGVGMSINDLKELFERYRKAVADSAQQAADEATRIAQEHDAKIREMADRMASTLSDAFENGLIAAFKGEGVSGAILAFGKTILAAVGDVFKQQGEAILAYGLIMAKLVPFLSNPFTSGFAAIAAGAALIALGSAFGAVAGLGGHERGGRSTAFTGSGRSSSGDVVRLKFVDRPTASTSIAAVQPIHFTIIGENDPKAQRMIGNIVEKNQRRKG